MQLEYSNKVAWNCLRVVSSEELNWLWSVPWLNPLDWAELKIVHYSCCFTICLNSAGEIPQLWGVKNLAHQGVRCLPPWSCTTFCFHVYRNTPPTFCSCQNLRAEAKKLREMGPGVQLFALGVSNARACELDIITGNGADLAFGVSDYNSFESFAKAMREVAMEEYNGCI